MSAYYSKIGLLAILSLSSQCISFGQVKKDTLSLSLQEAISIAQDSSLEAFIMENNLIASYWQYKNYQAAKLPAIGLNTLPFTFNRNISQQFDITDNSFRYFETQNLNSYLQLSMTQNLPFSGGSLNLDSDVGRLVNFGDLENTQFSATQIRIALRQPLFAYNQFKWDKKLEPLRYQKAKLNYVQSAEQIALTVLNYFFDLANAELDMQIAETNMNNADTLYRIGEKRFAITAIKESELLNLKLEFLNNKTAFTQANNNYMRAAARLKSYLNLEPPKIISAGLSLEIPEIFISPEKALSVAQKNNPDFLDFQESVYQAESDVEKTKKDNRFSANLDASLGLNQRGDSFRKAYRNPLEQERLNVSIYFPIVDWGLAKGKYKLAQREMETTLISIKQKEIELEQEIIMTILEFNLKSEILQNSREAASVAKQAYEISKDRFIEGLINVNELVIQQQKRDNTRKNYMVELESFWRLYYQIRSLTLYDFYSETNLVDMMSNQINRLEFN